MGWLVDLYKDFVRAFPGEPDDYMQIRTRISKNGNGLWVLTYVAANGLDEASMPIESRPEIPDNTDSGLPVYDLRRVESRPRFLVRASNVREETGETKYIERAHAIEPSLMPWGKEGIQTQTISIDRGTVLARRTSRQSFNRFLKRLEAKRLFGEIEIDYVDGRRFTDKINGGIGDLKSIIE